jgi:hypothetical protein
VFDIEHILIADLITRSNFNRGLNNQHARKSQLSCHGIFISVHAATGARDESDVEKCPHPSLKLWLYSTKEKH